MPEVEVDTWPADQADPLADDRTPEAETPAPAPEPVPLPTEEQTPTPVPATEPAGEGTTPEAQPASAEAETAPSPVEPTPAEVDWQRRFNDTRAMQTRTVQERNAAIAMAQQLQAEVQRLSATPAAAPAAPAPPAEPTDAELAQLGFDREQYRAIAERFRAEAEARYAPQVEQLTAQQQQMIAQIQADQQRSEEERFRLHNASQVEAYRTAHADLSADLENQMLDVLADVGALDDFGRPLDPLSPDVLDVAREAASDPNLRTVLRANPQMYETDEGMEVARRLASLMATSPPAARSTTAPTPAQVDARLQAVHTEPGGGGPPPPGGPPRDLIDEVIELDRGTKRSVFFS